MNKRTILLSLMCLMICGHIGASPINESRARDIAAGFMASRSLPSTDLKMAHKGQRLNAVMTSDKAAYYVFNAATGYVIVAGDDRVPAVLGYSDSGSFDAADVPPAMQEWLDGYAAQVEVIASGAVPEERSVARAPIAPMVQVRWNQGLPYNVLLPHISGSSNSHAYVGCVAVAMAQLMAYWQYPARPTTTIPGYTSSSGKTYAVTMPSLEPMDFDWENMNDTYYTNDSTSTECLAVANLMLYSTTAMKSNFGLTSTGAYTRNVPAQLIAYFGYKNSAHYIYREYFSTQAWEDSIYAELTAGRPVVYAGNKSSGGHAFVCDGYDGDGRFHINWGWGGKSNGYFLLNLLNPSEEGIGSAAGAYGYVKGQGAAIGLMPDDGTDGAAAFTFDDLTINSSSATRSSSSSNFSVTVSGKFVNYTNVSARFSQGWGLYNLEGELLEVLFMRNSTNEVGNGGYITVSGRSLSFGAGRTSGTYRIRPIYSLYPSEDYRPCIGSDVNYIEVTINDNYSCTIKGYGTAGSTTRYTVNSCTTTGTLNHGKPVTVTLTLTNTGTSSNDLVYMFVDGEFNGMGLANIGAGQTGDIVYRFTPTTAGNKQLTFSLNENGTPTLYSKTVTIATMPSATLDVSYRILNITDENNRIITADRYSIIADVTNTGTTTYDEDFSVRLYRVNNDDTNTGTELQIQTQPLYLPAGETKSLQFDFDHDLIDGWKYFCYLYYYSNGGTENLGTKWYRLNLTGSPDTYILHANVYPDAGGRASVSPRKAHAGDIVTVNATPNVGWQCAGVTVTASNDSVVAVSGEGGSYTFVMPEGGADITVNFTRSSGNLFQRIDTRADITAGDTYVLVSSIHDKVMKCWGEGDATFKATDVASWVDEDKTRVRVNDDACFFTLTEVADTTVSGNARTAAYLTTGNGYLRTDNYNVLLQDGISAESRAWVYIGNASNCLIRFKDTSSGSNANWIVRYDSGSDLFKVMNWNVTGAETSRVWLYKLVEETPLLGDVNGDGLINISDATTLTNYLLGSVVNPFVEANADMVQDGYINITDLTNLINYLLNNP